MYGNITKVTAQLYTKQQKADWSKFKAIKVDLVKVGKRMEFVLNRIGSMARNGKNGKISL